MNEAGPTEVARIAERLRADLARVEELKTRANERGWRFLKAKNEWKARAEAAEAEIARLRERLAEADRVIDMVEEDPALARSLARSYRDNGPS